MNPCRVINETIPSTTTEPARPLNTSRLRFLTADRLANAGLCIDPSTNAAALRVPEILLFEVFKTPKVCA